VELPCHYDTVHHSIPVPAHIQASRSPWPFLGTHLPCFQFHCGP
jgi:hypothetical protein